MKTRKIRNVAKEVCTAEQKIAYNLAFRAHISFGDKYRTATSGVDKSNIFVTARDIEIAAFKRECGDKKYNIDAIFVALNQGLKDYLSKPFIATDYAEIGKAFPIPYGVN